MEQRQRRALGLDIKFLRNRNLYVERRVARIEAGISRDFAK